MTLTNSLKADGWNPVKQLRVPKGNGRRSGRFIDMPSTSLDRMLTGLDALGLGDFMDTDHKGETPRERIESVRDSFEGLSPNDSKFDAKFTDAKDTIAHVDFASSKLSKADRARIMEVLSETEQDFEDFDSIDMSLLNEETDIGVGGSDIGAGDINMAEELDAMRNPGGRGNPGSPSSPGLPQSQRDLIDALERSEAEPGYHKLWREDDALRAEGKTTSPRPGEVIIDGKGNPFIVDKVEGRFGGGSSVSGRNTLGKPVGVWIGGGATIAQSVDIVRDVPLGLQQLLERDYPNGPVPNGDDRLREREGFEPSPMWGAGDIGAGDTDDIGAGDRAPIPPELAGLADVGFEPKYVEGTDMLMGMQAPDGSRISVKSYGKPFTVYGPGTRHGGQADTLEEALQILEQLRAPKAPTPVASPFKSTADVPDRPGWVNHGTELNIGNDLGNDGGFVIPDDNGGWEAHANRADRQEDPSVNDPLSPENLGSFDTPEAAQAAVEDYMRGGSIDARDGFMDEEIGVDIPASQAGPIDGDAQFLPMEGEGLPVPGSPHESRLQEARQAAPSIGTPVVMPDGSTGTVTGHKAAIAGDGTIYTEVSLDQPVKIGNSEVRKQSLPSSKLKPIDGDGDGRTDELAKEITWRRVKEQGIQGYEAAALPDGSTAVLVGASRKNAGRIEFFDPDGNRVGEVLLSNIRPVLDSKGRPNDTPRRPHQDRIDQAIDDYLSGKPVPPPLLTRPVDSVVLDAVQGDRTIDGDGDGILDEAEVLDLDGYGREWKSGNDESLMQVLGEDGFLNLPDDPRQMLDALLSTMPEFGRGVEMDELIEGLQAFIAQLEDEENYATRVMVAAAAPLDPDMPTAKHFSNPNLKAPTPLKVSADGRVYGHLATWGTCHLSHTSPGKCITPPSSRTGYAYFHTGSVMTQEGAEIPVGQITLNTRHAGDTLKPAQTLAHYDDTGTQVADVCAGEDSIGREA
jgi:hypothetical protein